MTDLLERGEPAAPASGFQSSPVWSPLVLTTLLPFHAGTGGVPVLDLLATARTNLTIVHNEAGETTASSPSEVMAASDRVLLMRRWLSLSVSEAARAFGVQRPTVYAWERGEVPAQKNLLRLRLLFELAKHWRSLSETPIGKLRKEVITSDDKTLVALLCERRLRSDAIKSAMTSLASTQAAKRSAKPRSGAELAQRFGFQPLAPLASASNITRESGRRRG